MTRTLLLLGGLLLAAPAAAQAPDTTLSRARALAEAGAWSQAADLFQRALAIQPSDRTLLAETIDALEACGRWREAIPLLDRLLASEPDDPRRRLQRGLFAAWGGDRAVGLGHLRRAAELAPRDAETLAALGEVLSWQPGDRTESREVLGRALARDPANPRALVAMANLDAWGGAPRAALASFDRVLAEHPALVAALLGRSGALEQLGRHPEARAALVEARRLSPGDGYLAARLARLEVALGHPRRAAALLDGSEAARAPEFRPVRDSVRRALGSSAGMLGGATSRDRQLDRRSARFDVALAVTDPLRVRIVAEPLSYREQALRRGGGEYGGGLLWRSARSGAAGEVRRRELDGVSEAAWVGGAQAWWQTGTRVRLDVSWDRSPVEESRISTFGTGDRGAIHAAIAEATLTLEDLPGGLAVRGGVLAGRYAGEGWVTNDRLGGSAEVTVALHAAGPHLRLGYAVQATRFGFNTDTALAASPAQAAGYFSPRWHVLHQAVLQASHRVSDRLSWEFDGRLGQEGVRARPGDDTQRRVATVLNTRLSARITSHLDLQLGHLYVDAFNAFRMHRVQAGLRQFF